MRVFDRVVAPGQAMDLANRPAELAGYYSMDEGTGTQADDRSENDNWGDLQGGVSWTDGQAGRALSFDGTSGFVSTQGPAVRTNQSFTVAAWVRLTDDTPHARTAVSQAGNVASGFYLQYHPSTDRFQFAMTSADMTNPRVVSAKSPPTLNEWTHLVGVYDAATQQLRLYVNGVFADQITFLHAWRAAGPLLIGRAQWNNAPVDWWAGQIDEVRIYHGVLTDREIGLLPFGGTQATS